MTGRGLRLLWSSCAYGTSVTTARRVTVPCGAAECPGPFCRKWLQASRCLSTSEYPGGGIDQILLREQAANQHRTPLCPGVRAPRGTWELMATTEGLVKQHGTARGL